MFQIHWRSVITGATGHGEVEFVEEQAKQIVEQQNREHKGVLVHWYQAADDGEDAEMSQRDEDYLNDNNRIGDGISRFV